MMNPNISNFEKWFDRIVRVALGLVFLTASVNKIADPKAFALVVYNYGILPEYLIYPAALLLPWIEAICGVFLIVGRCVKGGAVIIDILMIIFIFALVYNYFRGVDIACGCFSNSIDDKQGTYAYFVVRDIVFLAMGLWVFHHQMKIRGIET